MLRARKLISAALGMCAAVAVLSAALCGPELNAPGSGDVSGTWTAPGPAAGMTDITLALVQTPDGVIAGNFTATGSPNLQVCPQTGPCLLSSTVEGVNTVLQVNLELRDAGTFTGQLVAADRLRGTMTRIENTIIEFNRVPVP